MSRSKSIIGILISLVIAGLILLAGSHGSVIVSGLPLFLICGAIGFVLHWAVFMPSYAAQTEHYFDLTGSLSYITTVIVAVVLNPSLDIRDLIICAMIVIWAGRLGSFLFWRVKKDGQDSRFVVMKTKFTWFLMTWTIGGLWVSSDYGCWTGSTYIQYNSRNRGAGIFGDWVMGSWLCR